MPHGRRAGDGHDLPVYAPLSAVTSIAFCPGRCRFWRSPDEPHTGSACVGAFRGTRPRARVDQFHHLAGLTGEQRANDRAVVVAGLAAKPAADFRLDDERHVAFTHAQGHGVTAAR